MKRPLLWPGRRHAWRLIPVLLICLASAARGAEVPAAGGAPGPDGPGLFATSLPATRSFTRTLPWFGRVEALTGMELRAAVDGRVTALAVKDGAEVKTGELLLRLGGRRIASEQAGLRARIDALATRRELQRQTLARLEQSLRNQLATRDQVAAARQHLVELEEGLGQARRDLATLRRNSRVVAPVAGRFTGRRVNTGQDVAAGEVLGAVIGRRLRIAAALFPPPGARLAGQAVTVEETGGKALSGRVAALLPEADSNGATRAWLEGPQFDRNLLAGQTVAGTLLLETRAGALAVPKSAIVYDEQEHPLVFVRSGGDFRQQPVETGLEQDGWVEIRSGLEPTQAVVTRGAYELFYRRFGQQFKVPD
jgi:RND family efflux transporter MFP subunit